MSQVISALTVEQNTSDADGNAEVRRQLAHAAFYGLNEPLMAYLENLDGYEVNGLCRSANGLSLARTIELVQGLSEEQLNQALTQLLPSSPTRYRVRGTIRHVVIEEICEEVEADSPAEALERVLGRNLRHLEQPAFMDSAVGYPDPQIVTIACPGLADNQ